MPARYAGEHVLANSVAEAIDLLAADGDTRVLASGYSLLPLLKDGDETPDRLVDITGLDALRGVTETDDSLRIGALTTHACLATDDRVRARTRALAEATDSVGDVQAKRQGTIAGNLVFADPKYDAPAAFLALDGRVVVRGPSSERTVSADEWFHRNRETALESDELVTAIEVPASTHSGYVRTSEYSGYAIVGAAASLALDGDVVTDIRVAVNGAKPYPIRLPAVENALLEQPPTAEACARAANAALCNVDPTALLDNDAAAGDHRTQLVRTYCRRALTRASRGVDE